MRAEDESARAISTSWREATLSVPATAEGSSGRRNASSSRAVSACSARRSSRPARVRGSRPSQTFSATLSSGSTASSWYTAATPAARASAGEAKRTAAPSIRISPALGACTPASRFIRVDLPAPLAPVSACTSPPPATKSTASNAATAPKRFPRPRSSSSGGGEPARPSSVTSA